VKLEGKVALITGGTDGIGLACARRLRARGAAVAVCGLPDPRFQPRETDFVRFGDLVDDGFRRNLVQSVVAQFGRIDILVNCAGVGLYAGACDSALEQARRIFDVNLFAMLRMTQLVKTPMCAAGGGTIVNIGSIGGRVALPWSTMYCASKYAVHGLTEGLYRELRRDRIHVMLVVAGIVGTRFRDHVLAGKVPAGVDRIRNIITPERLAAVIVRGIEHSRRRVTCPRLASLFALANWAFPSAIDWYCARKWRSRSDQAPAFDAVREGRRPG
jgi:short-subunit dehydrogenase